MDDGDLGLRPFLSIFWRQRWVIAGIALAVAALAAAWSLTRVPRYEASATVLVDLRTVTGQQFGGGPSAAAVATEQALNTEIEVLTGDEVTSAVEHDLGRELDVTAQPSAGEVLTVTVADEDPDLAAAAANAYASTYLDQRGEELAERVQGTTVATQRRLRDLEDQIQGVQTALAGSAGDPAAAQTQAQLGARYNALQAERDTLTTQLVALRGQARDLRNSVGRVTTEATVPSSPASPDLARDLALGVVAGLLAGFGVALARHLLDDRVRTAPALAAVLADVPVLGVLPRFRRRDLAAGDDLVLEAHRGLRAAVDHARAEHPFSVVAVTGPNLGDGATFVAGNLSVALGQAGARVVAVDADLRAGRLHAALGVEPAPGLADLDGPEALPDALQVSASGPDVRVLPAGAPRSGTARLLGAPRVRPLLGALAGEADLVVLDVPPVLEVSDAEALAGLVDAVLLVVTAGTPAGEVEDAAAAIERAGGRLVGTVLNRGRPSDRRPPARSRTGSAAKEPAARGPELARGGVTTPL